MKEYKVLSMSAGVTISQQILNAAAKEGWVLKFIDRSGSFVSYFLERTALDEVETPEPFGDAVPHYRIVLGQP